MRARSSEASGSSSSSSRGLHQQRAAEGDALALAAGQVPRPALEQRADVEQRDDARALGRIVGNAVHPAAVVEITRDAHMREQPALLEHIADAAAVRRHVDARGAVEQHVLAERDAAAVGR